MINKIRILEEFLTLVKISSPTGNERQIADYLKNLLTDIGLTVTEEMCIRDSINIGIQLCQGFAICTQR